MGKALYRKYRSKRLAEIVGQEHITSTLERALQTNKVSHAYLFTGPRGVGKTSIARILAHEINQLAYEENTSHLDIIEIDAASNRRIDEIRDLRDRVHSAPTSAKYKVYIIDEVHMLTKEAFNALLKTLEEPPAHVIFILATTEAHKLPETIISRTQRFTFKPIQPEAAVTHLRMIADSEKIDITDEALALIASAGGGSFRDSISLLDQASNISQSVTADDVRRVLGIAPQEAIDQLLKAIHNGSASNVLSAIHNLRENGYQSAQLAKQLLQRLRASIIEGTEPQPARGMKLLAELLEVPTAHDIDTKFELVLLGHVLPHDTADATRVTPPQQAAVAAPTPAAPPKAAAPKLESTPKVAAVVSKEPAPSPPKVTSPVAQGTGSLTPQIWQQVLEAMKRKHNTLYSVVRMAEPTFDDGMVTLAFAFPFHQRRMSEVKNKQLLLDTITSVTGTVIAVECVVKKDATPPDDTASASTPPTSSDTPASPLETISNIFGGAEVLDS